jgi:hypothetical protein
LKAHTHAVGGRRYREGGFQQGALAALTEAVVLRPEHHAKAPGRRQVQGRQHGLRALLGLRLSQEEEIAGADGPPFETAEAGADIGGLASEHGSGVEAAFDGEIAEGASGEGADAQSLASQQPHALQGCNPPAAGRPLGGQYVDGRGAAGEGQAHALGLDQKRRTQMRDLQSPGPRRIADDDVGGDEAHGIERPGHGYAEALVALAAEVLQRGHQTGRHDSERWLHPGAPAPADRSSGSSRASPAALLDASAP